MVHGTVNNNEKGYSTMSNNNRPDGTKYQVNFRTRSQSLVNLYAETPEELSHQLEELEVMAPQIAALEGVFGAVSAAAPVSAPPSQQPKGTPVAQPGNAGAAPSCQHGPRVFREGVSKAGKPYKAWFCSSQDRNDQCKPEWS